MARYYFDIGNIRIAIDIEIIVKYQNKMKIFGVSHE